MLRSFDKTQDTPFDNALDGPVDHAQTGPPESSQARLELALSKPFVPYPLLSNPDVMTLLARWWPRGCGLAGISLEDRLFEVGPDSKILGRCHWQSPRHRHPTLLLIHGFEGCSESHYMLGLAAKGYRVGFNVIRLNQRNCGGTEHLTRTLYHSGLSGDVLAVVEELATRDGLDSVYLAGYSMGGNLALNAAGQLARAEAGSPNVPCTRARALKGIAAVCPNINPALAVDALERPRNFIYQRHFLKSLRARMRRKARCFPGLNDLSHLDAIRTLHEFDDRYTAPDAGYTDAAEYYERTGARHVLGYICSPTLIIAAKDDPFIPFRSFDVPALAENPWIHLVASTHGGHCGFLQRRRCDEDMYWAENRLVEFFLTLAHSDKRGGQSVSQP